MAAHQEHLSPLLGVLFPLLSPIFLPKKNWYGASVGRAVRYTPTEQCLAGAKTLAGSLSILKRTKESDRKQHHDALCGLDHRVKEECKHLLNACSRLKVHAPFSLLQTNGGTDVQERHIDDKPSHIKRHMWESIPSHSAIVAATAAGTYMLVFPDIHIFDLDPDPDYLGHYPEEIDEPVQGKLIYIPYGWGVVFCHSVLHAYGYRSLDDVPDGNGNLGFFYHLVPDGNSFPDGVEKAYKNGKRFSDYYVNPLEMNEMKHIFFYDE